MTGLWPKVLAEVYVLLGMGHAKLILKGDSMDRGYIVDLEMRQNLLFLKDADDNLDSLGSLRVFAPGFVVEHSRIIDYTCL